MPTDLDPDSAEYARRFEERAREQERRHLADPHHVPLYLPADDEEFPDESFTAGWQQEPGA